MPSSTPSTWTPFSFDGNLTQAEIGQRLGISQMHVSRLLTRALAYLRGKLTGEPDVVREVPS
jgi:DNA-directed RNA polymerase specialized sigma24 family protein